MASPDGVQAETKPVDRRCINCGKVVAADRKQRCNHCGEVFYARTYPLGIQAPNDEFTVAVTSRPGVLVGVVIALAIPVSYWVLAALVSKGIAPYDQVKALLGPLSVIALFELLLGPVGIAIAGWNAGIRNAIVWLALFIVAVPLLAFVWFLCVVTLSGALGEPF
jgi:hypothetical protein